MKKSQNITVEVQQADIDRAVAEKKKTIFYRDANQVNPIAYALKRKFHREVYVDGKFIEYKTSSKLWRSFHAPEKVMKALVIFDNNKKVKPFTIVLKPEMEVI